MTVAAKAVLDTIYIVNLGLTDYETSDQQQRVIALARQTILDELTPADDAYNRVVTAADDAQSAIETADNEEQRLEAIVSFRDVVENIDNEVKR